MRTVGIWFCAVILVLAILLAIAFPFMWLLNYVLSDVALVAVFGEPVTYWKAFCLIFLCGFLFKSGGWSKK